jgi:hypothetical protein
MLKDKKFLITASVSILIIVLIGIFRPREIDWAPSFLSADKIPYGTWVLYNSLPDIFGKADISVNTRSVYTLLHRKHFENTSLIFVQNEFAPTAREENELLAFAAAGNNLFISTGHLRHSFADTFKLAEKRAFFTEAITNSHFQDSVDYSQANFTNPALHHDSAYHFKRNFYSTWYKVDDDSLRARAETWVDSFPEIAVLGVDGANRANFIRLRYGKGYIYFHSNPYAFTNYYMLNPGGSQYVAKCFSYLAPGDVVWDESYKKAERQAKSPLNFILSTEALRWAYYTAMVFLLLYILFNIKRRQRVIPVVDPYKNTSLEFTETIGSLYFNQGNHKNIAHKKITYFFEFIRNRYGVDTALLDEEFARKLCYKSGASKSAVDHLINIISGIESKKRISDTELIDLNHAIEYFKNNCQ